MIHDRFCCNRRSTATTSLRPAGSPIGPSPYCTSTHRGLRAPRAGLATRLSDFSTNRHESYWLGGCSLAGSRGTLACLVCLVDLVDLVHLVYPVILVQLNKQDKPNKPNKRDKPDEQDQLAHGRCCDRCLDRHWSGLCARLCRSWDDGVCRRARPSGRGGACREGWSVTHSHHARRHRLAVDHAICRSGATSCGRGWSGRVCQ